MIHPSKKKGCFERWRKDLCSKLTKFTKRRDSKAGRCVHHYISEAGQEGDGRLGDHLIRFYATCGSLREAHLVFSSIKERSVFAWNSIISAHLKLDNSNEVLHLYKHMLNDGVDPDKVTFLCIIKARLTFDQGMILHSYICQRGLDVDSALGSVLVEFYSSFGYLQDGRYVFDSVQNPDVILWGTVIAMYSQNHNSDALKLFNAMLASGITPSHFILNCTFKACTSIQDTQLLHDYVIRNEFETDYIIGSSLVDMYVKLGDLNAAHRVFDKLVKHDIVSWGALIDGYARHNHGSTALALYCRMLEGNIKPDKAIFLSILEGCAQIQDIGKGRELHHVIIRNGFHNDITITSALVKLYAMCGSLEEAHKQFDTALEWDVVSLGALIAGYIQHGLYDAVIELVMEMQEENMEPDEAILLSLLKAYGGLGDIKMGWTIHDYFLKREIVRDRDLGNVLIDMYVGCGRLKEARRVFDILSARNEVSWGAMIAGYVQEGDSFTAFQLLHEMLNCQLKPDGIIYLSILKACIIMGAVMKGMLIHDQLIRDGFDADAVLSNMLLHMYASCKSLDEAQKVFKLMQRKDVVSWSALITGLASSGLCRQAEDTLMDMLYHGLQPDDTVFTIVLSSYVHNGSLMDGLLFYRRTRQGHPTLAHVNCLLDLFGRTGRLAEARELSRAMPFSVDMITHTTLLTNSKKFGDVHLGRHCFKQAAESNEERALYHLYNEVL